VKVDHSQKVTILHASLTDFLIDPTRSKGFWINPRVRHAELTRQCIRILRLKGTQDGSSDKLAFMCYFNTILHCKNAEITPGLLSDLINLSFDDFQDAFEKQRFAPRSLIFTFIPPFLSALKQLVWYFLSLMGVCVFI
jgi:hypothetical protein